MTVQQAIETRRSIRKYKDTPIEQEKLDVIAEAFRLSPSAGNGQNWKLYIVQSAALREKIRLTCKSAPAFVTQAPAMLVLCGLNQTVMTNSHRLDSIDVSIATTSCILQAWELGLGTCWMASYEEQPLIDALGLPAGTSVVAITPLGYPDETPDAKPRKPLADLVTYL